MTLDAELHACLCVPLPPALVTAEGDGIWTGWFRRCPVAHPTACVVALTRVTQDPRTVTFAHRARIAVARILTDTAALIQVAELAHAVVHTAIALASLVITKLIRPLARGPASVMAFGWREAIDTAPLLADLTGIDATGALTDEPALGPVLALGKALFNALSAHVSRSVFRREVGRWEPSVIISEPTFIPIIISEPSLVSIITHERSIISIIISVSSPITAIISVSSPILRETCVAQVELSALRTAIALVTDAVAIIEWVHPLVLEGTVPIGTRLAQIDDAGR